MWLQKLFERLFQKRAGVARFCAVAIAHQNDKPQHLAVSCQAQKRARSVSGPAFSDQNKSWLKRKQKQEEDRDDSEDLQGIGSEGNGMLSCLSHVQMRGCKQRNQ